MIDDKVRERDKECGVKHEFSNADTMAAVADRHALVAEVDRLERVSKILTEKMRVYDESMDPMKKQIWDMTTSIEQMFGALWQVKQWMETMYPESKFPADSAPIDIVHIRETVDMVVGE